MLLIGLKPTKKDPTLSTVLNWLKAQKKTDLKALLVEHASSKEGRLILWNWHNFTVHQRALYLCSMPKGETEDLLLFVVPKAHWVTTLNECHWDAGHQGCDCTLSLLQEHFWWPPIRCNSLLSPVHIACKMIAICPKCPIHPIVATTPLDLLHVDFTSIEMILELNRAPKVANVLVFQDHFMKHIMAYVTPNHTAKMVAKFLYQGYISIFGAPARLMSDWGATFMSSIIDEMCNLLGMRKLWTMPYHPHMNWLVERSHQTIIWSGSWDRTKRLTGQDIWLK